MHGGEFWSWTSALNLSKEPICATSGLTQRVLRIGEFEEKGARKGIVPATMFFVKGTPSVLSLIVWHPG